MAQLKNRQVQIPFGFQFYDTPLRFTATQGASFEVIVQQVIAARKANPAIASASRLSTDYNQVCQEVDQFNALICVRQKWNDFITEGGASVQVPFKQASPHQPALLQRLKEVAAGGASIVDWLKSGAEAVPKDQALSRAATCLSCPKHGDGDLLRYFTQPVVDAITAALNQKTDWQLTTPDDDKLNVCEACSCPVKLKIWMPIKDITKRMNTDVMNRLPEDHCWIRKEAKV